MALLNYHEQLHWTHIRDAVADIPFERIYQYDRQFRLRVAQNHAKTWAQIDGFVRPTMGVSE
jgi:hypothetical protein